jgi:hypothetical protein
MIKRQVVLVVLFLVVVSIAYQDAASAQVYDYQVEYRKLEVEITSNIGVPPDGTKSLEPYLDAMKLKSQHREKATILYGAALADNSEWAPALKALIQKAQESGDRTADTGAWWLLRIRSKGSGYPPDQWPDIIGKLKFFGRRLLTQARKYGFRDSLILDRAVCMTRFSVNDLEVGHLGLYDGREKVFAELDDEGFLVIPDRDFDVDCEQRIHFTHTEKGCPLYPTESGLQEAQKVRKEADWWGFTKSEQEAVELMDEFFRDTICIDPLSCLAEHKIASGKGLEHYRKLADEYDLSRSQQLVEDFYGTLHGKVEIYSKEGSRPASGAEVTNRSPKDEKDWQAAANGRGLYEIEDVPLYKYCGPYEVEATHEKGSDFKEYAGPLEEPVSNATHQEDLEIVIAEGRIEFNERFRSPPRHDTRCTYEEPSDTVSFKLIPTRDPCIFTLKGGVSNPVVRKEYCHHQHPTWFHESWLEYERQTRLVGGTVDYRDKQIPPFRPWLEHRRNTVRCDHHTVYDRGEEKRFSLGCSEPAKEWESTYLATPDVSKSFWGMEVRNGYTEGHRLGDHNGFSYTLHIDERPFLRLEERCRTHIESHGPEAAALGDAAGPTEQESEPILPTKGCCQEAKSEGMVLDRSQAPLSSGKAGASGTSGLAKSDESLKTHGSAPVTTLEVLDQIMPEDNPTGWFKPESGYQSSQFAARMWVKAPDHLNISLFTYSANENASRAFAQKNGTKLIVQGLPAVETSRELTILLGRYLLTLKGKAELIREFLPYLDLGIH